MATVCGCLHKCRPLVRSGASGLLLVSQAGFGAWVKDAAGLQGTQACLTATVAPSGNPRTPVVTEPGGCGCLQRGWLWVASPWLAECDWQGRGTFRS